MVMTRPAKPQATPTTTSRRVIVRPRSMRGPLPRMRVISAASPAAQSVGTESARAIAHAEDVRLPASA